MEEQDLIWKLRGLTDEQPFVHQVVQSPWHSVVDVPSLHANVKAEIRDLLTRCSKQTAIRCVTYYAPPGLGKTHVLTWTRQYIQESDKGIFIYVTPYTGGGNPFEAHLLQATLEALSPQQSQRQSQAFSDAVRLFLVSAYDEYVKKGKKLNVLRAGNFWSRLLNYWTLKIGKREAAYQEKALQKAFQHPDLLRFAFAKFVAEHPSRVDGVQADWDAFVAASMLCCGDVDQRWTALSWFRNESLSAEELRRHHLRQPCQGLDKVRNVLFTLQKFVGQPFCYTFDQMEDMINSFRRLGSPTQHINKMSSILRQFMVMPGFALIFAFIQDVWVRFSQDGERMLVQRMTEGTGALGLAPLKDETAYELLEYRMRELVWKPLDVEPPLGNPYYPFSRQDIRQLRKDSYGVLRDFLINAHKKFKELIAKDPEPRIDVKPDLKITNVEPTRVPVNESIQLKLSVESLPEQIIVYLNEKELTPQQWLLQDGCIFVEAKLETVEKASIRIRDAENAGNEDVIELEVFERSLPALKISEVTPTPMFLGEPTKVEIRGKHFPKEIQVFVRDQLLPPDRYTRDGDVIRLTLRPQVIGLIPIRVADIQDPQNAAAATPEVVIRPAVKSGHQIQITHVEPNVIPLHQRVQLRIYGENFPGEVELYIAGTHFGMNAYDLHGDYIEMSYLAKHPGELQILIHDAYNKANRDTKILFVKAPENQEPKATRPYYKSLDRQLLRNKRESLGLSQRVVGEKIGKSAGFIGRIENGHTNPDDEIFEAICQVYGETAEAFVKKNFHPI